MPKKPIQQHPQRHPKIFTQATPITFLATSTINPTMVEKAVERVPRWVARFLLPEIRSLVRTELADLRTYVDDRFKAFDEKLKAFDEKLKAFDEKLKAFNEKLAAFDEKFKAFDERLISLRNETMVRFDSLEKRLDVLQRVAVLEAEVKELKQKLERSTT
ncbi:MAG: hypothetical protein QXN08_04455 [Nitrososphaerales archaeon]